MMNHSFIRFFFVGFIYIFFFCIPGTCRCKCVHGGRGSVCIPANDFTFVGNAKQRLLGTME